MEDLKIPLVIDLKDNTFIPCKSDAEALDVFLNVRAHNEKYEKMRREGSYVGEVGVCAFFSDGTIKRESSYTSTADPSVYEPISGPCEAM